MNREISYRYHSKEEGMVYDIAVPAGVNLNDFLNSIENLMEKTGYLDKNGNPLYEFDIVRHHTNSISDGVLKIIENYKGCWIARPLEENADESMLLVNFKTNHTMEAVGNVFLNKELIFLNDD